MNVSMAISSFYSVFPSGRVSVFGGGGSEPGTVQEVPPGDSRSDWHVWGPAVCAGPS